MLRGFRPIRIPVDGGRRMDMPAGYPEFPGRDSPDIQNIIVWDGVCRKWPGMVPYTSVGIGAPVRFLGRFELGGGTRHLVASDGRDLWSFDPGGPSWINRTPTYTTGTAKFTHDSTTVEGTDTAWDSDNCWAGMKIKNDADGTWYEVADLTDATHLELTVAYTGTTTGSEAYTLRQRRSAAGEYLMRAAVARDSVNGDQIMVVNGIDAPLFWDGEAATFAEVAGSPPNSRFITTFHQQNLMVLARDGNNPFRVHHSDAGNYTDWLGGLAATYDFEDSTARITGVDGGHEYLYLFREDGIQRGFWEGTGVGISWSRISGIDGPVYPNSLVRLGGEARMGTEAPVSKWAYFGVGNVFAFDGDTIVPIGDPVRPWLFDRIDPEYPDNVVGVVIPEWGLAVWSFPTIGSGGVCTDSVAYDYKHDRWFPRGKGWSAFAGYDLTKSDDEWDDLVGTVDAQTRLFDAINVAPQPVCLVGDESGYVYYLALGVNDNGAVIRAQRSTPVFSCDEAASYHEIGAVAFRSKGASGTFNIVVYGGDRPEDVGQLQSVAVPSQFGAPPSRPGQSPYKAGMCIGYFRCAARYIQVRVDNEEVNRDYGLYDLTVWVRNLEA